MKKTISVLTAILLRHSARRYRMPYQSMQAAVTRLDKAASAKIISSWPGSSKRSPTGRKKGLASRIILTAFCNAKTGGLLQRRWGIDRATSDQADEEIRKAQSLLDTATHKKQLSEVYVS